MRDSLFPFCDSVFAKVRIQLMENFFFSFDCSVALSCQILSRS